MKKFIALSLIAIAAIPAFANTTTTTTTSESYESSSTPMMNSGSTLDNSEMIEAEEYDDSLTAPSSEAGVVEEERMEETSESDDMVDYNDRTRTNRARHAINTGGDASDDH